jgi:hypothetical protein
MTASSTWSNKFWGEDRVVLESVGLDPLLGFRAGNLAIRDSWFILLISPYRLLRSSIGRLRSIAGHNVLSKHHGFIPPVFKDIEDLQGERQFAVIDAFGRKSGEVRFPVLMRRCGLRIDQPLPRLPVSRSGAVRQA